MKRTVESLVAIVLLLLLTGACREAPESKGKPIAKVNDRIISETDFRRRISDHVYFHDVVGLTEEQKQQFLQEQIRRELLIQTAIGRELHEKEDFRRAIEKFWEQTLITSLLKQVSKKLEKQILVTNDEILAHWEMLHEGEDVPPLEEDMKRRIENRIREEKKTEALEGWIEELKEKAEIEIYRDNLHNVE
jgi:hypothetical protein